MKPFRIGVGFTISVIYWIWQGTDAGKDQVVVPSLMTSLSKPLVKECPPCPSCFNCLLPDYKCENFASCNQVTGRCEDCPVGFSGDNCALPLCNGLGDPRRRPPPEGQDCTCSDGWSGMNCNVCQDDWVCQQLPEYAGVNATCYKRGVIVGHQFRSCRAILPSFYDRLLKGKRTRVTFDCRSLPDEPRLGLCHFQFWLETEEAFYCQIEDCKRDMQTSNVTYVCPTLTCKCLSKSTLCDSGKIIDLTPLLETVKGPASLECHSSGNCTVHEPQLDAFFEGGLRMMCDSGECLRPSQVPGFETPRRTISVLILILMGSFIITLLLLLITGFVYFVKMQRDMIRMDGEEGSHLVTPEEETRSLMDSHTPSKLVFRNLSYNLGSRWILHSINGQVAPGQVLAIMGASGSGKTTTLDLLAAKNKAGQVHGDILINNQVVDTKDFRKISGYVDQEDTLLGTLTVRETLTYSALLRLPRSMSMEAKKLRVRQTMEELGIDHIADRIVGHSEKRGISGGEKRRLSIAQELVTSPSILFLDEPTSGLDTYNAFVVMESLVQLARKYHRTIVCTIHQPRSDIFAMFDRLLILSCGQMIYSGSAGDVGAYFESIGLPCPPGYNMADHIIDSTMTMDDESAYPIPIIARGGASRRHTSLPAAPWMTRGSRVSPPDPSLLRSGAADELASLLYSADADRAEGVGACSKLLRWLRGAPRSLSDSASASISAAAVASRDASVHLKMQHLERRARLLSETFIQSTYGQRFLGEIELEREVAELNGAPVAPVPSRIPTADLAAALASADRTSASFGPASVHLHSMGTSSAMVDASGHLQGTTLPAVAAPGFAFLPLSASLAKGSVRAHDHAPFWGQVRILSGRTLLNLHRNPFLLYAHYGLSIFLALFCGCLFFQVTDDMPGVQNRLGCIFFICAFFAFGSMTSLEFFARERILFLRERSNGFYHPLAYYFAKVAFDLIPLRTLPPLIFGSIVYYLVGLYPAVDAFCRFLLVLLLFNMVAASFCLVIGIMFKHPALGNLTASLIILFSMLFGGFLLNKDRMPYVLSWLKYLSMFNYAYEALIVNELINVTLHDTEIVEIDIPGVLILRQFGFDPTAFWKDVAILGIMLSGLLAFAFLLLRTIVKEKK